MTTVPATTPYPWPYDGVFAPGRAALLVLRSPRTPPPAPVVGVVAAALRAAGGVVVSVTTAPPRRPGRATHPIGRVPDPAADLDPLPGAEVDHDVKAAGVDGFYASALDQVLRASARDQLLLAGAWLETSVHSTMRSANDRGYECLLLIDACTAHDAALLPAARSQVEMSGGIFGAVGTTADLLAALTPHAHERTPA